MDLSPHVRTIPVTERDIPVLQMVIDQYVAAQDETDAAINRLVDADIEMEQRHQRRMTEHRTIRRDSIALTTINIAVALLVIWTVLH